MTKIASDAMVIQLAVDMAGDGEVQARLARLNDFMQTINAKAKASADTLRHEGMAIEGKYNPEIQRNLEIEKAIALTAKYNLSAETQLAILAEIEEKHRKIIALQSQQYSPGNMPGDDMVVQFRKNQLDLAKDEEELLAARKRAAKETARLEEQDLSHKERLLRRYEEIREQRRRGEIDNDGAMLRARAARREYDEAKKADDDRLDLIQKRNDAEKKAAADEKALFAARLQALNNSLEEEKRLHTSNDRDAIVEANQRRARASIEATELADKQANAERQKAINLLHSLEDATQRYTRVSDELRAHLDAGDITNEQYAQGLANIERRQRAMAGGANHMAYAIGNTVTGLEDFVTVLSITGFGMEGFSAATRSASNNVGQAVRSLGTASAAIAAPLVSIGMVLAGAAIPQIYRYVMGTEDADKATRKLEESLKSLQRTANLTVDRKLFQIEADIRARDIAGLVDTDSVDLKIQEAKDKISRLELETSKLITNLEKEAGQSILGNIAGGISSDFELIVDALGKEIDTINGTGSELEQRLREGWNTASSRFFENVVTMSASEARLQFERDVRALQQDIQTAVDSLPSGSRTRVLDAANGYMNSFINLYGIFNDAQVIDQIQAAEEALASISKEESLAVLEKRRELEAEIADLKLLQAQRAAIEAETSTNEFNEAQANIEKARQARMQEELDARDAAEAAAEAQAKAQYLDQQAMEAELEKLRIQQRKNSLLGDENEAERNLLDLAIRRKELMESGIAAPDVLEGLFNAELEAMANELEKQIDKAEEIIRSVSTASESEAYTSANRQIVEAMDREDTKRQEMVDLLKAIRDHLSGAATLQVEII